MMPALFTMISMPPKTFFPLCEKRGDSAGNRNIGLYGHSPPARGPDFLDDIFGVSGVASVVDDDSETVRSGRLAMAAPIPREEPVTIATLD